MSTILDYINSSLTNSWFSNVVAVVSILIGLIGLVLAYITNKQKSPSYSIFSTNIYRNMLTSKIEPLLITYADVPIENLTVTKILFWNAGSAPIRKIDIADGDKLKVHVKDGYKILYPPIKLKEKTANKFEIYLAEDPSFIILSFDFLNKGDGAIIQFFHTGKEETAIEVSGTIIGGNKLKLIEFSGKIQNCWYSSYLFFIIIIETIIIIVTNIEMFPSYIKYFIYLFIWSLFVFIVLYKIYAYNKNKIPNEFRKKYCKES
ncbi:MAG: hypothetical protein WA130_13220 [Candidatus Methanoperedens sp.]